MSSRPVRCCRRRKANLELDLNRDPPADNVRPVEDGPSAQQPQPQPEPEPQPPPQSQPQPQPQPEPQPQPQPEVQMIDVDDIDDDVVESSPRAFAEAKRQSRRIRRRIVVDLDMAEDQNNHNRCRRDPPNQTIINLESSGSSMSENSRNSPAPPVEPVFNCPICMSPIVEEMSTRCGHIFCKKCIRAAIAAQAKCPTCRKKVTLRELIRVFLPTTS